MATDPKYVHSWLFEGAIEKARPLLRWPISKVERKGSLIRIDAPEQAVYFWVNAHQSGWIDEETGRFCPYVGGDSYDLELVSEARHAEAEARWNEVETSKRPPEPAAQRAPSSTRQSRTVLMLSAMATIVIVGASFLAGFWVRSW